MLFVVFFFSHASEIIFKLDFLLLFSQIRHYTMTMNCNFLVPHFICFIICQAFADLIIKVLDENDSPPVFKENSYEAAIAENSLAGKTVVPVSSK